jgi:hypothetical protein
MRQANKFQRVLQFAASPIFILFCLALYNLLDVPVRNAPLCFHNWSGEFYVAFSILLATCLLWVGKSWSNLVAVLACCSALYDFCYTALLYAGFLSPSSPNIDTSQLKSEDWLRTMPKYPEEFLPAILATVVLTFALYYLIKGVKQKPRVFK